MTPVDYRAFLESRGFHVARRSFAGKTGPLWYMQEDVPLPPAGSRLPKERKYFIDLANGQWQRWGTGTWRPWDDGPWHELAEPERASPESQVQTSVTAPAESPSRRLSAERVLVVASGAQRQKQLF